MPGGRGIAAIINDLLTLPFALKVGTQDFHPHDHVSFATSHASRDIKAFESSVSISNPRNESEVLEIPVWPSHCVQNTKGAEIIPEIDASKLECIVQKGKDSRVEMFSAFADVFGNISSTATNVDLTQKLRDAGIKHIFIVGLAGDYCVRCTALDGKKEGFEVFIVEEAVKSVDVGEAGWGSAKEQMHKAGIHMVHMDGPEVEAIRKSS